MRRAAARTANAQPWSGRLTVWPVGEKLSHPPAKLFPAGAALVRCKGGKITLKPMATKRQLALYLAPAFLLITVFFVAPLLFVLYMSFQQWAGLGPVTFVGFGNFADLLGDLTFRTAVKNTLLWAAVGIFLHTPLCLLVALMLAKHPPFWKTLRTVYFFPSVISTTAIAFLWYFIFHVDIGLLNSVLNAVGLDGLARPWLSDPRTALWATQTPFLLYIGFGMVLFLTQISAIPREYYEAATIDGASHWQQDLHISLPLLRRTIAMQVLLVVGYVLKMFEYPFLMTSGGPANSTTNLSLYIYRKMITANEYGMSMAAGLVTLLLGLMMLSIVFLFLRRSDEAA
jgi:multiple sugar transport system permease protein/raffinose/stachyose/melibiose transport system permease protein